MQTLDLYSSTTSDARHNAKLYTIYTQAASTRRRRCSLRKQTAQRERGLNYWVYISMGQKPGVPSALMPRAAGILRPTTGYRPRATRSTRRDRSPEQHTAASRRINMPLARPAPPVCSARPGCTARPPPRPDHRARARRNPYAAQRGKRTTASRRIDAAIDAARPLSVCSTVDEH